MTRQDMELLKANISYNPITGEFKRLNFRESSKIGYRNKQDRKSTRLNSSHIPLSRMPSSA